MKRAIIIDDECLLFLLLRVIFATVTGSEYKVEPSVMNYFINYPRSNPLNFRYIMIYR